jgi:hypothetical protein
MHSLSCDVLLRAPGGSDQIYDVELWSMDRRIAFNNLQRISRVGIIRSIAEWKLRHGSQEFHRWV